MQALVAGLESPLVSVVPVRIPIETFRTTVWRMKGKTFTSKGCVWLVHSDDRGYWKQKQLSPPSGSEGSQEFGRVAELDGPEKTEQRPFRTGENVGSSPTPPSHVVEDDPSDGWSALDDDIPF